MRHRPVLCLLLLSSLFASLACQAWSADAVEDWERDLQRQAKLRISQLILGLNAAAAYRDDQVNALVKEAEGENATLVRDLLHQAFEHDNPQIREGVVDVLARIDDPQSVPLLARQVEFDTFLDLRLRILRVLPLFLQPDDPKVRADILALAERENYSMTARLRAIMRRGPIRLGSGEYDAGLDHLRRSIVQAVASQLDPIGTAIEGLETKKNDVAAQEVLRLFCGRPLATNKQEWREKWMTQGLTFESPLGIQLTSIETAACRTLADIGAEGTENVVARLKRLVQVKQPAVNEAALNAIAELAGVAHERIAMHRRCLAERQGGVRLHELEAEWHEEGVKAGRRMLKLALEAGLLRVTDEQRALRAAAYRCLGASRSPEAVEPLRRRFIQGSEPPATQICIARALGQIGGEKALQVLNILVEHKSYANTATALADEHRLVLAAMEALRAIAGHYDLDTKRFTVADPHTGRLAVGKLLELLKSVRELPGGPRRENGEPLQVRDLALRQLQLLTGLEDERREPKVWEAYYDDLVKQAQVMEN